MRIISIILILLLLLGCESVSRLGRSAPKQLSISEVHVGSQGVEMKFVDGAPPSEVLEKNRFEIGIEVENKGAADADGVYVFGVPVDVVSVPESSLSGTFKLRGRTSLTPVGDVQRFVLLATAGELLEEHYPTLVTADVCYEYNTKTSQLLCIKPESALQRERREICTPADKSLGGGQGGPVGVVLIGKPMISPEAGGNFRPVINMRVQNLGTGTVVDVDRYAEMCGSRGRPAGEVVKPLINVVKVNAKLSDAQLVCNPPVLKLTEDSEVSCTLREGESIPLARGTYEALFEVELQYGYVQQKTKSLVIKKIL